VIAADIFVRRVLAADVDFACAASAGLLVAAIAKDDQCEQWDDATSKND
jgi:hypothetical protein